MIRNGSYHHSSRKWAYCNCQEVHTLCSSLVLGSRTSPGEIFTLALIQPFLSYVGKLVFGFIILNRIELIRNHIYHNFRCCWSDKIAPWWPRTRGRLRRRSVGSHWSRSASTCGDMITEMLPQIWSELAFRQQLTLHSWTGRDSSLAPFPCIYLRISVCVNFSIWF